MLIVIDRLLTNIHSISDTITFLGIRCFIQRRRSGEHDKAYSVTRH